MRLKISLIDNLSEIIILYLSCIIKCSFYKVSIKICLDKVKCDDLSGMKNIECILISCYKCMYMQKR